MSTSSTSQCTKISTSRGQQPPTQPEWVVAYFTPYQLFTTKRLGSVELGRECNRDSTGISKGLLYHFSYISAAATAIHCIWQSCCASRSEWMMNSSAWLAPSLTAITLQQTTVWKEYMASPYSTSICATDVHARSFYVYPSLAMDGSALKFSP